MSMVMSITSDIPIGLSGDDAGLGNASKITFFTRSLTFPIFTVGYHCFPANFCRYIRVHASFTNPTGAATNSGQTQIRATQTKDAGSSIDNWPTTLKRQNIASGKLHRTIQLQLTLLEAISALRGKGMAVASLATSADKTKVTLLTMHPKTKTEIQQRCL